MGGAVRSRWRRVPLRARIVIVLAAIAVAAAVPTLVLAAGGGQLCHGLGEKQFACVEKHLAEVVDTQGGEAALAELARLRDADDFVLSNCHVLAHSVGHAALKHYKTVAEASNHGDGTCWSGYYHGVYEQYMSKFSDAELPDVIRSLCPRPADDPYSFDHYNCVHGVGHGVTIRFGNDPFKGLPYCDVFDDQWERSNCYTGVFMQNIVVDSRMHTSVRLDPSDPIYPCDAVEEKYKGACYLGQTSYVLRTVDYDYAKAFAVCDEVESDYVDTCYVSMGRDISGNSHRDAAQVVERCSLGDPAHQAKCYVGAARNAVFHDHGTPNADALCAIVPAEFRVACREARDDAVKHL